MKVFFLQSRKMLAYFARCFSEALEVLWKRLSQDEKVLVTGHHACMLQLAPTSCFT